MNKRMSIYRKQNVDMFFSLHLPSVSAGRTLCVHVCVKAQISRVSSDGFTVGFRLLLIHISNDAQSRDLLTAAGCEWRERSHLESGITGWCVTTRSLGILSQVELLCFLLGFPAKIQSAVISESIPGQRCQCKAGQQENNWLRKMQCNLR